MKQFLISLGVQVILWLIATVICGMLGITLTFFSGVWFVVLIINVLLGTFINFLIGNY